MKLPFRAGRVALLLAACALALSAAASAASVTPTVVSGNPTCADLGLGSSAYKPVDRNPSNGTYTNGDGFEVTISNDTSNGFDWSANQLVEAVIVKAGTQANVYTYDPDVTGDTGLTTPDKQDISHVDFCYDQGDTPPPPPQGCTGVDSDGDGVADSCDNCPSVSNPDQTDRNGNGNGMGDARTNGRDPEASAFAAVSERAGRTFWMNPEPKLYWNYGDSVMSAYEPFCDGVFECWTVKQLEVFVNALALDRR